MFSLLYVPATTLPDTFEYIGSLSTTEVFEVQIFLSRNQRGHEAEVLNSALISAL